MHILIQTSLSTQAGMGHGVRCLALAQALAAHGADVSFLSTSLALEPFVKPFLCDCIAPSTHEDTFEIIQRTKADVLIVDTKEPFDDGLYSLLMQEKHVVRIDHPHATPDSCHLLVGPCAHWLPKTVEMLRASFGDRFLYGWDYVMLPQEVTSMQPLPYADRWPPRIVCCAGGSDPEGVLPQMWQWLHQETTIPTRLFLTPNNATYTLPNDAYSADVLHRGSGHGWPYRTGQEAQPFQRRYLQAAMVVVTMLGLIPYECLWYRTPQIVFSRTSEDAERVQVLQQGTGQALLGAGVLTDWNATMFCSLIRDVYERQRRQGSVHTSFLDGHGTQRVAEAILRLTEGA